jgi:FkbM family methyltransferase
MGEAIPDSEATAMADKSITRSLLIEKAQLEAAMRVEPKSLQIRTRYFELLNSLSRSHFGLFFAIFPEIATPLIFRSASSDLHNLEQIYLAYSWGDGDFYYGDYGFDIPTPSRILDLGAYCGYTGVYFANRFPQAEIVCVEPSAPSFRLLLANTAPYPNIRCLPAAVWHERTELEPAGHLLGDWGNYFAPTGGCRAEGTVPGYTISEILQMHGWDEVDFIKCVVEDASVAVLSNPGRPWLKNVACVATKPVAGRWPHPSDESTLLAAFPDQDFGRSRRGEELIIFKRRSALAEPRRMHPEVLRVIPSPPETRRFALSNVSSSSEFYTFGDSVIHFTPTPAGSPPASVILRLTFAGQRRFSARLRCGPARSSVTFNLRVVATQSGTGVFEAGYALPADTAAEWNAEFAPLNGLHEISLSAQRAGEDVMWAEVVDATFL